LSSTKPGKISNKESSLLTISSPFLLKNLQCMSLSFF
jgi:hypothetical protein